MFRLINSASYNAQQLYWRNDIVPENDAIYSSYIKNINTILNELKNYSSSKNYTVTIVRSPNPYAYTVGGGKIWITTGMIKYFEAMAQNQEDYGIGQFSQDAKIATTLAHEIAHNEKGHLHHMLTPILLTLALFTLKACALGVLCVYRFVSLPAFILGLSLLACLTLGVLLFLVFRRENQDEIEAECGAFELLKKASKDSTLLKGAEQVIFWEYAFMASLHPLNPQEIERLSALQKMRN